MNRCQKCNIVMEDFCGNCHQKQVKQTIEDVLIETKKNPSMSIKLRGGKLFMESGSDMFKFV